MSLEEKLSATRALFDKRVPADKAAIMHRATEDLRASGILDRIVKVGARMLEAEDPDPVRATDFISHLFIAGLAAHRAG